MHDLVYCFRLIGAYALTRLMTSLVTAPDVTTFVLVSIGLSLVALVALRYE